MSRDTRARDSEHTPAPGFDADAAPSAAELQEAQLLSQAVEVLDDLESGYARFDELPVGDSFAQEMALIHGLRAIAGKDELSAGRSAAIWEDIEGRLEAAAARRPQPSFWSWRWMGALASAVALVLLVGVVGLQLNLKQPSSTAMVQLPPAALAEVEAQAPSYAMELLKPEQSARRDDTPLRDYREARFEAWRVDTSWRNRHRGGGY